MRKAVIQGGIVVNVIEADDDFEMEGAVLVASETAGPGWLYSGGVFSEPPAPEAPAVDLVAYAAGKRFDMEVAGITLPNGARIDTTRDSQAMINGAYAYSQKKPSQPILFKAATGFVTLDAATMDMIATAVGDHVQSCFAKEAEVVAAIAAGTITTAAEIDAAFATLGGA